MQEAVFEDHADYIAVTRNNRNFLIPDKNKNLSLLSDLNAKEEISVINDGHCVIYRPIDMIK